MRVGRSFRVGGLLLLFGLALASACGSRDIKKKVMPEDGGGAGGEPTVAQPAGGEPAASGGEPGAGGEPGSAGGTPSVPAGTAGTAAISASAGRGTNGGSGSASAGAASTSGGSANGAGASNVGTAGQATGGAVDKFSFFVTSQKAMVALSKSPDGFGGDLRYGEATGLAGADKICSEIAESSMPGSTGKQWRAFLSTATVNAADRIGNGPWYDRTGRLVAGNLTLLLTNRPGADAAIAQDLPNESGIPNHQPDPGMPQAVNSHVLTGSDATGKLFDATATCLDWTSNATDNAVTGRPRAGYTWSSANRTNWISGMSEGGCGASVQVTTNGDGDAATPTVASGGGYGAIYCFALTP